MTAKCGSGVIRTPYEKWMEIAKRAEMNIIMAPLNEKVRRLGGQILTESERAERGRRREERGLRLFWTAD